MTPALAVEGLGKQYVGVRALHDVSFVVQPGTVHALVGENGAGKSTLIKLVAGADAPSAGTITIGGERHAAMTPQSARALGIRLVPQERHVCSDLSVAENVLLGRLPRGPLGLLSHRRATAQARDALQQVGLTDLDPRTPMRDLTVAQTQVVEIARALSAQARLVIMDEPTAALTAADITALFDVVRRLRERGVAFLYVSHHLEEIFELADELTVLRDGQHVTTRPTAGLAMEELVRLIVGRDPDELQFGEGGEGAGETVIEVRDARQAPLLHGVSFDVRAGEVLAVTGAIGSGRSELARALIGVERLTAGEVRLPGIGQVRGPAHAVANGIAFLPEDRKGQGILGTRDITDNIDLGWLGASTGVMDRPSRRKRAAAEQVARLGVKTPGLHQHARRLSGGNQQKMLLGRWLGVGARVLVLDGPTEGIDIGSKLEIYALLRELCAKGVAVVIFTSDLEEARLVADRAIGLRRGRIAGELSGADITEQALLALQYGTTMKEMAAA